MKNSTTKQNKNQANIQLYSLITASKYLDMHPKNLREFIYRNKIVKGIYRIGKKNIRINLKEFLDNFNNNKGE